MHHPNLASALRSALGRDPGSVPTVLANVAREVGASDVVLYLVDFGQIVLEPLESSAAHKELPHSEEVASTMAGRSFLTQTSVSVKRDEGFRIWVPVLEGSDRTGVLALTLPDDDPETLTVCEELGLFAGYLVALHARVSDVFNLHRRRKAMTLAASMQWDLLPPLVYRSSRVTVAGFLEPAYEVGGDCFDYAINGPLLDTAVMDAMGHGINSALLAGLAIGSYRHDRRQARTLEAMHRELDATIAKHYPADGFVTGQLLQLNVETGSLFWTNAGHPPPLLIRRGRVIGPLVCKPTPPWGIGLQPIHPAVASEDLEPEDSLLFYSDGAIDGRRSGGGEAELERLLDLVGHAASEQLPPEQVVRNVGLAILESRQHKLEDDITLMVIQWHGPAAA